MEAGHDIDRINIFVDVWWVIFSLLLYFFSITIKLAVLIICSRTSWDASQTLRHYTDRLEVSLLEEDVHDQLNGLVWIKISVTLLVQAFLNQVNVKDIVKRTLEELWLIVDCSDLSISDLPIIPRIDLVCQIKRALRDISEWISHLVQNSDIRKLINVFRRFIFIKYYRGLIVFHNIASSTVIIIDVCVDATGKLLIAVFE